MAGVTFDSGVLIAADRNDRRAWAWRTEALARRGVVPVVPAATLVQAWRGGRNANMVRFLKGCRIEALEGPLARVAGELCGSTGTADVVDAVVVASAATRGDVVVTGDPEDLAVLSVGQNVTVVSL